jgi:hypothetical protein
MNAFLRSHGALKASEWRLVARMPVCRPFGCKVRKQPRKCRAEPSTTGRRVSCLLGVSSMCLAAVCAGWFTASAAELLVSNVRASQRAGTNLVDIYYDVTAKNVSWLRVSVSVSTNNGVSYSLPASHFSGPGFGHVNRPGNDKQIVWDAGADWNGQFSTSVRFRVTVSEITTGIGEP